MAVLSIADRTRIWRGLLRRWSAQGAGVGTLLKYDIYNPSANTGVVADIDAWVDGHAGLTGNTIGYSGALSIAARAQLSADQKSDVLIGVVCMRRGVEYLRTVFGQEVD